MAGQAAEAEWLEADGAGGFASGTAGLIRTRRYHALLLPATRPPTGRILLVNGIEAWLRLGEATIPLSSQRYAPDIIHPDGATRIASFTITPWPTWIFELPDGSRLTADIFVAPGSGQTSMRWRREGGDGPATLYVRPLLSGRDYHALHHENPAFRFDPVHHDAHTVVWESYPGLPPIAAHGGTYDHAPDWFRRFSYAEEQARGMDFVEDLASPGILSWDLSQGEATLALRADREPAHDVASLAEREAARRAPLPPLHRSALQHMAGRGGGQTIIAGFPWFTDWGRDTFIALRGILIATGRHDAALAVLLAWSDLVSEGMLPNRFPDAEGPAEFNSVDASLWFVVAVHDLFAATPVADADAQRLRDACRAIVDGYTAGTRFGIRRDTDGLLICGEPGVQLTWMDAKVGDWVVTPRAGKPVEVQALWINALAIVGAWTRDVARMADEIAARAAVLARFVDPDTGGLVDVVDVDGVPGAADRRIRPNQIFAVGGLPHQCVPPDRARAIVDLVAARLLTPLGLRTLDPADPDYRPRYDGDVLARDGAYHQGTAWPWLSGPFVEAALRVHGPAARRPMRDQVLTPLRTHLNVAGLGGVSEIADAEPPHTPRGCPFQAWSIGEMIRIEAMLDSPA